MTKAELNKKPKSTLILMATLKKVYKGGKKAAVKKSKAELVNALYKTYGTKKVAGIGKTTAKRTRSASVGTKRKVTKKTKGISKIGKQYLELKKKISGALGKLDYEETEIYLTVSNDYNIYNRRLQPIYKNLVNKMAAGKYNPKLAAKLFKYAVEDADKQYQKDFGSKGRGYILSVKQRQNVAEQLEQEFRDDALAGDYEHLLYKKYQK
jgi:hypothetical protein